jgi:uncharacterized membrane protein YeiH
MIKMFSDLFAVCDHAVSRNRGGVVSDVMAQQRRLVLQHRLIQRHLAKSFVQI